jgi:hypothetical protein
MKTKVSRKLSVGKLSVIFKLICRFNAVAITIPTGFICKQADLKIINGSTKDMELSYSFEKEQG